MPETNLVLWDVYGTLIATHYDESTDCGDIPLKLRPGALEILSEINSRKISQATISDGDLGNLKNNFKEVGIDWINYFDDLYQMTPWQPKDISYIIEDYNKLFDCKIKPENVLVIGDNYEIDIKLAKEQGCQTIHTIELIKYGLNPLPIDKIREMID